MKKICIVGHFNFKGELSGGQTIKTHIISDAIKNNTNNQVKIFKIDTANWKRKNILLMFKILLNFFRCKDVIFLPAQNGIKVFLPLFTVLKILFKVKLHYIVTGAWLANLVKRKHKYVNLLKKIDYIYVQTSVLKNSLCDIGICKNLVLMPNFKHFDKINEVFKKDYSYPFKLCVLSRIEEKKGILEAIEVVSKLNESLLEPKCELDIYGPVKKEFEDDFYMSLKKTNCVKYLGNLHYSKINSVLKNYNLLLFPTKYFTEGLPGTIIDAYSSGVPVLASRWASSSEFIIENKTGLTYEFDNRDDFANKLHYLISKPELIKTMKKYCLNEAQKYHEVNVIKILLQNIYK